MKKIGNLLVLLALLLSSAFIVSCETDVDLTAEWKEITIVYGLLNKDDTTHYLRINKAFMGDGNNLEYAKISDSSSYYNNLEVSLTEYNNQNMLRVLQFDTIHVLNKEPGTFYNDKMVAYKSNFKIPASANQSNFRYDLKIRNRVTGKEVTSSTTLVKDFDITAPRYGQPTIEFTSDNLSQIVWRSAQNGRRYDVFIRLWFKEVFNGNDTIDRYIDWSIGNGKSKGVNGGEEMKLPYTPSKILEVSKSAIPYKDGRETAVTARLINKAEFTIVVAGDELNTYIDINGASSGIVQDKPEYTNIENGLGLLSSRTSKFVAITVGRPTEKRFIEIGTLKFVDRISK